MSLYPTPRRKRFLEAVDDLDVYSQTEGDTRQSYYRDGAKCTDLADQCERAGWIEKGAPLDGQHTRFWWRRVKDSIEEEKRNG